MTAGWLLVLKVVVTPLVIVAATLAGRRWGPAVSGSIVGLPLTSGPIAVFVAADHGAVFARTAALGTMLGAATAGVFCVVYSRVARHRPWTFALPLASASFVLATALVRGAGGGPGVRYPLVLAVLLLGARLLPRDPLDPAYVVTIPRWDLPARMVLATTWVVLLTGLSARLGATLTGLISPFPVFGSILASFAHAQRGAAAAAHVLRGLLFGMIGFASFFLVEALVIRHHVALAFVGAASTAVVAQGVSLWWLRRPRVLAAV